MQKELHGHDVDCSREAGGVVIEGEVYSKTEVALCSDLVELPKEVTNVSIGIYRVDIADQVDLFLNSVLQ